MAIVRVNVFNVTDLCPVCRGSANVNYHSADRSAGAHIKRKCDDCGFSWQQLPAARCL